MENPPNQGKPVKKVNVVKAAKELAEMLAEDKSLLEKDLIKRGNELLGFFADDTMRGSFKNFDKMKLEAIRMAIEDVSTGAKTLRRCNMGLTFSNGKILTFVEPFGETPSGNVIYSINLKEVFAFQNWRTDESLEISQDDLNAAIYRLAWAWAELLYSTGTGKK